jgi:hypothetical protein
MTTGPATDAICTGVQVGRVKAAKAARRSERGPDSKNTAAHVSSGESWAAVWPGADRAARGQNSDGTQGNEIG